jgi:isoleucyl-tRNA synthetase
MDADKAAAYRTLYNCLWTTAELIAPFTPFFAETLYQNLVHEQFRKKADALKQESVHLRDYPQAQRIRIDVKLLEEMSVVREIASLGRAARSEAKLKVRQPLPVVELVLADPSHRAWLEAHLPLIQDELNVKRVEFTSDADKYVRYEIKPNFKSLGPRLGPLAPKVKAALGKADAADLRRQLDASGRAKLDMEGQSVELTVEDVQVALSAKPGWAAAQGRQVVVVLSTEITPELKAEGMARDFVHLVQTARKEQRLDYQDRIHIRVAAAEPVASAIQQFRDYIMGETLATELATNGSPAAKHQGEIEGAAVAFSIEVAS